MNRLAFSPEPEHPDYYRKDDVVYREEKKIELADALIQLPQNTLHDSIKVAGYSYNFDDVVYYCKDLNRLVSMICSSNQDKSDKARQALADSLYAAALEQADLLVDDWIEHDLVGGGVF